MQKKKKQELENCFDLKQVKIPSPLLSFPPKLENQILHQEPPVPGSRKRSVAGFQAMRPKTGKREKGRERGSERF